MAQLLGRLKATDRGAGQCPKGLTGPGPVGAHQCRNTLPSGGSATTRVLKELNLYAPKATRCSQNTMEVPVTIRTNAPHGGAVVAASQRRTVRLDAFRRRLLAGLEAEALRFELLRATFAALGADCSATTTGRDRAVAALRMYCARAVIEEIEDAIVRIESGTYGTCQSCHRPISLERLEMIPHAGCCAFCPAALTSFAARRSKPRLRHERGEEAGALASLPVRFGVASPRDRPLQTGEVTWQPNR